MDTIKLITHSGGFHADDMFSCATLLILLEQSGQKYEIIRTRDIKIIETGDYVFDIGAIYDPDKNRFDHHQRGGAGKRENGIPYASFGLVWKKFGPLLCENDRELVDKIDRELICAIDANDNGFDIEKLIYDNIRQEPLSSVFMINRPVWLEEKNDVVHDMNFIEAVKKAQEFLKRFIFVKKSAILAKNEITEVYNNSENKKVLVFEKDYERTNFISSLVSLPKVIFYIYPNQRGDWSVETVPVSSGGFEKRRSFPATWGGLRHDELAKITGVPDAIFCHNSLFLCAAQTKEGVIKLAELALKD